MVVATVNDNDKAENIDLLLTEISSWIQDEGRCVTVPSIAWTWGMSRVSASQRLIDATDTNKAHSHAEVSSSTNKKTKKHATIDNHDSNSGLESCKRYNAICIQESVQTLTHEECIPETVFQFSKSVVDSNQLRSLDGTLYALSLHDHNSSNSLNANTSHMLNAAHARDMVNLRDAVTSQHYDTIFPSLLVDSDSMTIEPSVSIPIHNPEVWKTQRRQMTTIASDPPPVSSLFNTKHPPTTKGQGRKPTTAHSFFASNQKSASNTSSLLQSKATVTKTTPLEKENSNIPTTNISTPIQFNTALSTIGNVDDFVGDIEEDDDFLQQEALRQERRSKAEEVQAKRQTTKKASARPQPPLPPNPDSPKQQEQQPNINRRSINPLSQSSDGTDAETHTKVAAVPGIKRRKTLVDKTTMDEHGYLHTETVVVWEDLPDDPPLESSQPHASSTTISKPSHSRPIKSTTNFKQGTLRGFFTPK